jgi:hypothetical protein
MLVGFVEEASQKGLQSKCVEVIPAGFLDPDFCWIAACFEADFIGGIGGQAVEGAVAVAQIQVAG